MSYLEKSISHLFLLLLLRSGERLPKRRSLVTTPSGRLPTSRRVSLRLKVEGKFKSNYI